MTRCRRCEELASRLRMREPGVRELACQHPCGTRRHRTSLQLAQCGLPGFGHAEDPRRRSAKPGVSRELRGSVVKLELESGRKRRERWPRWLAGHRASPPSTGTTAPVIALAPGPAKNATTSAISAGSIRRRSGCWLANALALARPYRRAVWSSMGVLVEPGLTALAVTPVPPSSAPSALISPATPAFAAQ